jgi:micrococcal nuclease
MYTYSAIIDHVVDGDTLDLTVDLGFKLSARMRVRLAGVDTPEKGQPLYQSAKQFVLDLCGAETTSDLPQAGQTVTLRTEKVSKWGYYLAHITLPDGTDLSSRLIEAGLGRPYNGGPK